MRWLGDPFNVFGLVVALLFGALIAGIVRRHVSWAAIIGQALSTFALLVLIAMFVFGVRPAAVPKSALTLMSGVFAYEGDLSVLAAMLSGAPSRSAS